MERVLLDKFNFKTTLRLAVLQAFRATDGPLTQQVTRLYSACPQLFERCMARTDEGGRTLGDGDEDTDDEGLSDGDKDHSRVVVSGRCGEAWLTKRRAFNNNNPAPRFRSKISEGLSKGLMVAWRDHYGKANMVAFSRDQIRWRRRVGFSTRYDLPSLSLGRPSY